MIHMEKIKCMLASKMKYYCELTDLITVVTKLLQLLSLIDT